MNEGIIKIAIGTEKLEIDTESEAAIHEISSDMDNVSARIAYYGELLGAAEEEEIKVDAAYRNWRAKWKVGAIKKNPKAPEWKIMADIEASDTFLQYKDAIGKAKYNVVSIKNLIKGLEEKSPNLRSKGARQRAELDSTDMTTKSRDLVQQRKDKLRARKQK